MQPTPGNTQDKEKESKKRANSEGSWKEKKVTGNLYTHQVVLTENGKQKVNKEFWESQRKSSLKDFTHLYVVSNLYEFLSYVEHFEEMYCGYLLQAFMGLIQINEYDIQIFCLFVWMTDSVNHWLFFKHWFIHVLLRFWFKLFLLAKQKKTDKTASKMNRYLVFM